MSVSKRNTYDDFSQFIAAIKAAERLGLPYRAERREICWTSKPYKRTSGLFAIPLLPLERDEDAPDQHNSVIEYVLEILSDQAIEVGVESLA